MSWTTLAALSVGGLVAAALVAAALARRRSLRRERSLEWAVRTGAAAAEGGSATETARVGEGDSRRLGPRQDWADLPSPVRLWLERSGAMDVADGSSGVVVSWTQRCELRLSERSDAWTPFVARQVASADPPAFCWSARSTGIGPPLRVVDAFACGHGHLRASLAGVVTVLDAPAGRALDAGELLRWLAELPWLPEAARPGGPVRWRMKDGRVQGRVHAGVVTVGAFFDFDDCGDVVAVETPRRPRLVGDGSVATPWRGTFEEPAELGGVRVPRRGEVAWVVGGAARTYWRGEILRRERKGVSPLYLAAERREEKGG